MEYIEDAQLKELLNKLELSYENNKKELFEIKEGILNACNSTLGIDANKVLKSLVMCLKTPKEPINDYKSYFYKCSLWFIEHKREYVCKETGRFVNVIEFYQDFRDRKIELTNYEKKLLELIYNHLAYENNFLSISKLVEYHKQSLKFAKNFENYFAELLKQIKEPLPISFLETKANELIESYEKLLTLD